MSPLFQWTRDIIVLVVFVFAFRAIVAEANWIPTRSMVPTLEEDDKIIVEKVSLHFSEIERGEIVTFYPPRNESRTRFIKRIIGLPGETIEIINNDGVYINNQRLDEPYVNATPNYNYGPFIIPEGEYFLLGDNRRESQDSHVWGPCPQENIIGCALFRYWPLNHLGAIDKDKDFKEHYFE